MSDVNEQKKKSTHFQMVAEQNEKKMCEQIFIRKFAQ